MKPVIDPCATVWETEAQRRETNKGKKWGVRNDHFFPRQKYKCNSSHLDQSLWAQEFLPNIFIGEESAAIAHYETANANPHDYGLIIDVSACTNFFPKFRAADEPIFSYHISNDTFRDSGDNLAKILDWLAKNGIFQKIDEAVAQGKKVLINCQAGQSRSPTIAILYMMHKYKIGVIQAYRHLRKHRSVVCPNAGYFIALLEREEKNIGKQQPSLQLAQDWLHEYANYGGAGALRCDGTKYVASFEGVKVEYVDDTVKRERTERFIDFISFLRANDIPFTTNVAMKQVVLTQEGYKQYQSCLENWKDEKKSQQMVQEFIAKQPQVQQQDPARPQAQQNTQQTAWHRKMSHLCFSQLAAFAASSAIVTPSILGLTEGFIPMHAIMLTGGIFAISTAVCIGIDNKNLTSSIVIVGLETGVTATLSYVSFTYITPVIVDAGLAVPAADAIMCASIATLLLIANFTTGTLMNRQTA